MGELFGVAPSTVRSVWQRRGAVDRGVEWGDIKPYLDAHWTRTKTAEHLKTSKRTIGKFIVENNYVEPQEVLDKWIPCLSKYLSRDEVMKVSRRGSSFVAGRSIAKSSHQKANHNYFQNICDKQAYWIGFLLADGNVFEKNNGKTKTLSMGLQFSDREIVEELFRDLGGGYINYSSRLGESGQRLKYVRYTLNSSLICEALSQYGVVPNKTKELRIPLSIEPDKFGALLRGLFDGDGSIIGSGTLQSNYSITISGQMGLLSDVRDELNSRGIYSIITRDKRSVAGGSLAIHSAKDKSRVIDLMYPNFNYFGLNRKKVKCKVLSYIINNAV